jgi:uncharacterized membrane protein YfcA
MEPTPLILVVLGVFVGAVSGLIGIGGGVVLVPLLVFLFKTPQHLAQGTSLAMLLPPIGVLAVYGYYKRGQVDVRMAALLCVGFVLGGLLGAKLAGMLSPLALRRVFGAALFAVSVRMMFF